MVSTRNIQKSGIFYRILRCRVGATAIEYGLILGLIAVVAIVGIKATANKTINVWNNVSDGANNM